MRLGEKDLGFLLQGNDCGEMPKEILSIVGDHIHKSTKPREDNSLAPPNEEGRAQEAWLKSQLLLLYHCRPQSLYPAPLRAPDRLRIPIVSKSTKDSVAARMGFWIVVQCCMKLGL